MKMKWNFISFHSIYFISLISFHFVNVILFRSLHVILFRLSQHDFFLYFSSHHLFLDFQFWLNICRESNFFLLYLFKMFFIILIKNYFNNFCNVSHSNSIISTSFFENQILQIFLNRFYFEKFRSIALFQCIIFYVMLIKKNMFLKTYNQMRKNQNIRSQIIIHL